jgi:hypothetical protein
MTESTTCTIKKKRDIKIEVEIEGQTLSLPKSSLPKEIQEGDVFNLYFLGKNPKEVEEKQLAKYILEEILNGH